MSGKNIYLVFSKTGTWLSNILQVFTEGKYVHASISFDDSFTKMYSFGRTNPDNPFSGGFVIENLYDGVYKKFDRCECIIFRVPVTEEQFLRMEKRVSQFVMQKDKLGYNFLGLFGVLLNTPLYRKDRYFCSQFVSTILMESRAFEFCKTPELITTDELLSISNKELVFEGRISGSRYRRLQVMEG